MHEHELLTLSFHAIQDCTYVSEPQTVPKSRSLATIVNQCRFRSCHNTPDVSVLYLEEQMVRWFRQVLPDTFLRIVTKYTRFAECVSLEKDCYELP